MTIAAVLFFMFFAFNMSVVSAYCKAAKRDVNIGGVIGCIVGATISTMIVYSQVMDEINR